MIMLYFSGTGNSKYIAELFCRYMNIKCYSIEENIEFGQLISFEETICFCYPILGLMQGAFIPKIEKNALGSIIIDNDCTQCLLCISICPMKNLKYEAGQIMHNNNCTICYRCINKCPQKAIKLFFNSTVKKQYKGLVC